MPDLRLRCLRRDHGVKRPATAGPGRELDRICRANLLESVARPVARPGVRTDAHAALLRDRAAELDQLAAHAPHGIGTRLRANAERLRATADSHDATAQLGEALS